VQPPYNVWTESPHGGTINFITGAGGFLQSAIFGTSGLRLHSDHLTFNPPPPRATVRCQREPCPGDGGAAKDSGPFSFAVIDSTSLCSVPPRLVLGLSSSLRGFLSA